MEKKNTDFGIGIEEY